MENEEEQTSTLGEMRMTELLLDSSPGTENKEGEVPASNRIRIEFPEETSTRQQRRMSKLYLRCSPEKGLKYLNEWANPFERTTLHRTPEKQVEMREPMNESPELIPMPDIVNLDNDTDRSEIESVDGDILQAERSLNPRTKLCMATAVSSAGSTSTVTYTHAMNSIKKTPLSSKRWVICKSKNQLNP